MPCFFVLSFSLSLSLFLSIFLSFFLTRDWTHNIALHFFLLLRNILKVFHHLKFKHTLFHRFMKINTTTTPPPPIPHFLCSYINTMACSVHHSVSGEGWGVRVARGPLPICFWGHLNVTIKVPQELKKCNGSLEPFGLYITYTTRRTKWMCIHLLNTLNT